MTSRTRTPPPTARGRLGGRVTAPSGRLVPDAQVVLASGPAHLDIAALTDADGRFAFGDLLPGRYLLRIEAPGFASRNIDVRVCAGMRAEVAIELSPPPRPARQPQAWEAPEIAADEDEDEEGGW